MLSSSTTYGGPPSPLEKANVGALHIKTINNYSKITVNYSFFII